MKKFLTMLIVSMTIMTGCSSPKNEQEGVPTETVSQFNKYLKESNADVAYSMFSQRIKKKLTLEDFRETISPKEKQSEYSEMLKNIKMTYDSEKINNNNAIVFGTIDMPNGISFFRQRCVLENNAWKIDSEVIEDRHPELEDFYRDIDLQKSFTRYCDSMLKGDAQLMYEMSSSNIKSQYSFDLFKTETTATGTDKTPEDEGFLIEAEYSYSDDKGNGICIMRMGNPSYGTKELQSGIYFKLPWVLENGQWKANHAKIDNSYRINQTTEQQQQ
ncbi:MAG: hypothetical protein KA140_01605 [Caldisericia bacterium]|nr:hypothetical protein [Caldisericia bacterium]